MTCSNGTFPRKLQYPLPLPGEGGFFGDTRRFHRHEGIDLYCKEETAVHSLTSGIVIKIGAFTGSSVGSPWWNETQYLLIATPDGKTINYGEILVHEGINEGMFIKEGQLLGKVLPVLKKDKGRPMAMLHIELYDRIVLNPVHEWPLGTENPDFLVNPIDFLKDNCYYSQS